MSDVRAVSLTVCSGALLCESKAGDLYHVHSLQSCCRACVLNYSD